MWTLESVLNLVINDLKYANYLMPMRIDYRKYLKLFRKRNYVILRYSQQFVQWVDKVYKIDETTSSAFLE